MSLLIRSTVLLLIASSLSTQAQVSAPHFVYPVRNWSVCMSSSATDIRSLLETTYSGSVANLSFSVLSAPLHGTVALSSNAINAIDGTLTLWPSSATYTPAAGYSGTDVVVFRVTDGTLSSQLTLTMTDVPPPPPPGAIVGQDVDTVGRNPVRYTIDGPTDPNASYVWTYTGSWVFIGASLTSGTGNPVDITFSWYPAATSGVLSVAASNNCGTSTASTKAITVLPIQFISFDSIPSPTYGDPDFYIGASSTSELPVRFVVADTTIARLTTDWTGIPQLHIIKAGQTTVTAYQDGGRGLEPATPVVRYLVVKKKDQFILSLDLPFSLILGYDTPPALNSTATSGLPVQYTSSDTTIATIDGNQVNFHDAGTVTITAIQPGDNNYNAAAPIRFTVQVLNPAKLPNGSSLFPNPAHGVFYCLPDPTFFAASYILYNSAGRAVTTNIVNYDHFMFAVETGNARPGIYYLKVFGRKDGKSATQQFTVFIR